MACTWFPCSLSRCAFLAQLVERLPYTQNVGGSSPSGRTKCCPCSSVVEHSLGKGEVGSSILLMGTRQIRTLACLRLRCGWLRPSRPAHWQNRYLLTRRRDRRSCARRAPCNPGRAIFQPNFQHHPWTSARDRLREAGGRYGRGCRLLLCALQIQYFETNTILFSCATSD